MPTLNVTFSLSACALAAALLVSGTPASAQTTALSLVCAPDAALGSAATPLVFRTDASWTMSNDGGASWNPAYTEYKHTAWIAPEAGSNWLTPGPVNPSIPTPAGIDYRSPSITVGSTVDVASIQTSIVYAVDNFLDSASVNSVSSAFSGANGFSIYQPDPLLIPASASSGWVVGSNNFSLNARNAEAQHNADTPTGVLATITVTATCLAPVLPPDTSVPVPVPGNHPIALLLTALALLGLGAIQWKKRSIQ